MNRIFVLITAMLLLLAQKRLWAQPVETQAFALEVGAYQPMAVGYNHGPKEFSKLTKVGTVMSGAGVVAGVIGAAIIVNDLSEANINNSSLMAGLIMFIAGGAVGITGGCLAIAGVHQQRHGRYGFNIVAPKNNQLGIAYNF